MASSFELPEVDHITTGTIGPPGQRVFYLQAAQSGQVVSLRLEKTQVAALVRYLGTVLSDLPPPDDLPAAADLIEPVVAEWVVGALGISYDEGTERFVLEASELVPEDAEDEAGEAGEEGHQAAVARFGASRAQMAALALHGAAVVAAGRPPCPLCGQPLDAEGHVCARLDGHREL